MEQTKLSSLIEAVINNLIAFPITFVIGPIVYPFFGHTFSMTQNLGITAVFSAVSIVRSYVIRRWFNAKIKRMANKLAHHAS